MRSLQRLDPHHVEEPADEQRWVGSHSRPAHPFGGGVGMLDPLPRARLIGKLLQDQNLVRIVESLETQVFRIPAAVNLAIAERTSAVRLDTLFTDANAATTTPGTRGVD